MVALFITSIEKGTGKTAIAAGLARYWTGKGKKVGFFKPIIAGDKNLTANAVDSDTAFMKDLLGLEETADVLSPVITDNLKIKDAYARVSKGKDVVIVEGISEDLQNDRNIAGALEAKAIMINDYSKEKPGEGTVNTVKTWGKNLLGIVINKVPQSRLEQIRGETSSLMNKFGVNVLGVLPDDRTLCTMTIGELAGVVQGDILNNKEKSGELVENLMLGALYVDSGLEYFGRKANKTVILKTGRADMQLAALQTSTKCLVLSDSVPPNPTVLYRAEQRGIPVILVKGDVSTVVSRIDEAMCKSGFSGEKLARLTALLAKDFNFQAVDNGIGLAK